ncbi:transcriptional regulator [Colletotrichum tofieldiae]|uniref:Transcriptional regulator n=1 Tax=Colletotrichum tofieldiae TaxID=708197 RepID=A0A166Z9Q7_9PEZI|nr:transcriptional regulator [Colletotrichum tofieldiae]GKT82460.1 transcriptional regulator [Colletotrichum tofieldiae]
MSSSNRQAILVTAGSGNVGTRLIPLLVKDYSKPKIIIPTSDSAKLLRLVPSASEEQVVLEEGNIKDPRWFQSIISKHSVTSVFLCLTGSDELFTTMNCFDTLIKSPSVKHLVYLSACGDFSPYSIIDSGIMQDVCAAHIAVKFLLEAKLWHGLPSNSFAYTLLGPSLFFSNDIRSKDSLMEKGFYAEPLGSKGVSRVDPFDIALGAYNALKDQGRKYGGRKFMIGSLKTYTNVEIAHLWSNSLGRHVEVAGSDVESLETFETRMSSYIGPAWGRDMRLMYELFESVGFGMSEEDYKSQVELLGKEPEDYVQFVEETAKSWLEAR